MSTRPAPRPRPRPRPRAVTNEPPPSSSPDVSTTALPAHTPLEPVNTNVVEDEDAMFFRNRNRTAQTWKKLHQLAEGMIAPVCYSVLKSFQTCCHTESEAKKPKPSSDDDSDSESEEVTPRKKQKKGNDVDSRPAWTKSTDVIDMYVQLLIFMHYPHMPRG